MIAEIIINSTVKNLNRIFDYNIPKEIEKYIKIGSRVLVPFGNIKQLEEGFVVGIKEKSNYKVKDIKEFKDTILTKENIEFAKWMSKRYFCNIFDCIKLMLPPGTSSKKMDNRVKEKTSNYIYLAKSNEEIEDDIEQNKIKSQKHLEIIKFLKSNNGVTLSELEMFTCATRSIVNTLLRNQYIEIIEKEVQRNPFVNKTIKKDEKFELTKEQRDAFGKIKNSIVKNEYKEYLIYGVTGSGKTEVYMQLIEEVINSNKTAIVLVPEISLTPQMVDRFIARFGDDIISVLHSKLSIGERYDQWKKIKNNETKIVIGARSAIFAPINNLGLIIIDEEHDSSYKSEMNPRYNAKEISNIIAKKNNIPLILGSATPDINTFYKATKGDIELIKLTKRANNSNLPSIEIVDLRQELANGNKSMLSMKLYNAIKENIEKKRQTILFLNRRGFSTFIMCRDCGYTVKCKNCNISLTYHKKEEKLRCHYCGYQQDVVKICPECNSTNIRYFGTGTQRLELEINKIFPKAKTIRMDVDTVSKKNSYEEILNKFKNEDIDILIGTQMIVKGHHFPNVTLVGVVAADSSLNIDDYRANETTFDLLVQVAGRAGRENLKGNVVIQTYNPDNFSVQYAKEQNYEQFYKAEILLRKQLKYPPFSDIIMFGISSTDEKEVQEVSNYLYNNLIKYNIEGYVFKPMSAPIDRIKNRNRWRIIIKTNISEKIIDNINELLKKYYNSKFKNTRVIVDVNPINLL